MNRKCLRSGLLIAFMAIASLTHAEEDYYKEIRKNFKVNNNVRLDMDVSFANANIQTWDQAQMEIIVKMDVVAKSEERANELFDSFSITVTEGMDLVGLHVSLGNCNSHKNESTNVSVEIKMPALAVLDGKCSFGDVNIGDMKGPCQLGVEYGSFHANGLWSFENDVYNAFGDAKITGTNGGEFKNEYGSLDIGKLQGSAEIHSSFGDLDINRITKDCKDLDIKVEYADADLNLDKDVNFTFEMHSSYGDIELPEGAKKTSTESDYTSKEVKGTIGSGGGKLEVECDFGDVDIDVNG